MESRTSLPIALYIPFWIAFLIMAFLGCIFLWSLFHLNKDFQQVNRSHSVLTSIERVQSQWRMAESYQATQKLSLVRLKQELGTLSSKTNYYLSHQQRVKSLDQLFQIEFGSPYKPVNVSKWDRIEIQKLPGKNPPQKIQWVLAQLKSEENDILAKRRLDAWHRTRSTFIFGTVGAGLTLLIVVIALVRMKRAIDLREKATELAEEAKVRAEESQLETEKAHKESERARGLEEKARQAAEMANEAKSLFLTNVSHELITPINGILGMTELLLDSEMNKENKEYVQLARTSTLGLLVLVRDILDFSKIEAGELLLKDAEFNLSSVVNQVEETLAVAVSQKGLKFITHISADVPKILQGDPDRLQQILYNLSANAVKFTDRGEINLQIQEESKSDEKSWVRFSVSDTGIGIPEEKRHLLWESFSQVDIAAQKKYGGAGLGLTLCHELIKMMGGRLEFESEVGKGAKFWFILPISSPTL